MAYISGGVLFNTNNASPTTGTGVQNVPIVMRNKASGMRIVVLTDSTGNFTINNVPTGNNYTIVEAWGTTGGVASPADFNNATVGPAVTPTDPPLSAMPSQPAGANAVQSLGVNTYDTAINGNQIGFFFYDGPVNITSTNTSDLTLMGSNLITAADNGTWGSLSAGSSVNSSPSTDPYTVSPAFIYAQSSSTQPMIYRVSLTNTNTLHQFSAWFNLSAPNIPRDETNRFLMANADGTGNMFFRQTINVTSNSYYYMGWWIANMYANSGAVPVRIMVQLTDIYSNVVYSRTFPDISTPTLPTWVQLASYFYIGNYTQLTFALSAEGAAGTGSDLSVDDIVFQLATPNTIITATKTVDKEYADVGDTINYTVVLQNTGQSTAISVNFQDTIPNGATFNSGSVKINGTTFGAFNPTPPGFSLTSPSQIAGGQLVTITYSANVTAIPVSNNLKGTAVSSYNFSPISGGSGVNQTILSNNVSTTISSATISATKYRDLYATLGSVITYTIPVRNIGNTTANNVILIDTIPSGTTFVDNSVIIDGVTKNGLSPVPPTGINLGTIVNGAISTLSFKVTVTTSPAINSISNSAFISYNYTVDPTMPLGKSGAYNTNIATSQFNYATISSSKTVNTVFANLGDILSYTIAITHSGTVTANNIVFIDTIPNGTSIVGGSFKQDTTVISGSPNLPGITLPNPLGIGKTTTVTFNVVVNTIPSPNPITNNANIAYTYTVNPSTPNDNKGILNTNTVSTQVNHATFEGITKYVDKIFSYMGDTITYTIVAPNSGNITAVNVIFRDTIPNGTTFITNSVTTNGIIMNGVSPVSGITLPDISPGGVGTITFQVLVG